MKNTKFRKKVILSMMTVLLAGSTFTANAAWKESGDSYGDGRWWYEEEDGSFAVGWRYIDNEWYYFDDRGRMQTGWIEIFDNWYYMEPISGKMLSDTWVEQYYLGEDGALTDYKLSESDAITSKNIAAVMKAKLTEEGLYPGGIVKVDGETKDEISVSVGEELSPVLFKRFVSYTVNKATGEAVSKTGGIPLKLK